MHVIKVKTQLLLKITLAKHVLQHIFSENIYKGNTRCRHGSM